LPKIESDKVNSSWDPKYISIILDRYKNERKENVFGQWYRIGETSDGKIYYVDMASIVKSGTSANMWAMIDLESPDYDGFDNKYRQSKKYLKEYDCNIGKVRAIRTAWFSGRKLSGFPVYSSSEAGNWVSAPPGSFGEIELNIACDKN
jgi:hypothetical protein